MSDYEEDEEGFHFNPTDEELINNYLIPKLNGGLGLGDFIEHKNVYDVEPWLLDHNIDPFFPKNEWYYFVTRTQVSQKNIGRGKKTKRQIMETDDDGIHRGNWRANATTDIEDSKTGKIIGKKQTLTYTRRNKKQKREGSESSWIMKEYMLPEGENFQELVLCKININKSKKNHDHEASTSTFHNHDSALASSSDQQQELISALANMNTNPLTRLGEKSLPIELADNSNEDEERNKEA